MRRQKPTHCHHCGAEHPPDYWSKIQAARIASIRAAVRKKKNMGLKWGGRTLVDPMKYLDLKEKGLSHVEMAKEMNVNPSTIRRVAAKIAKETRQEVERMNEMAKIDPKDRLPRGLSR